MRSRYARVSSVDETSRRRTGAAWSSADANGSMTVNGADSGGRVGRRGQGALEGGCVFRRNRHEQATAGLGVAQHHLVQHDHVPPIDLVAIRIVVAAASAGKKCAFPPIIPPFAKRARPHFHSTPP